ncbi:MAG: Rrf2 family transcriptional regulator [Phycisphaerae bacterium]|nr:Rrf2 family transcriptional regulator [Phycisphaerae bacterium]
MKLSKGAGYALHALMYMVRHITQLPLTVSHVAKAEGIPAGYLSRLFQTLSKAGLIRALKGRHHGYVFAKSPEKITLLEIFETIEGRTLFGECLLKHCNCGGTPNNCRIFKQWQESTQQITDLFSEITLTSAAWTHPEHRFEALPESPPSKP